MAKKPIRVFYSTLSGRFYATQYYRIRENGLAEATGEKFDVTNDIANLIAEHEITFSEKAPSRCAEIPIVAEREANCAEPWHIDDGVPYCDTCGLFRASVRLPR